MLYEVRIEQAEPQAFAGTRERVAPSEITKRIIPMLDRVWAFLRAGGIKNLGLNVAVYLNESDDAAPLPEGAVLMEAGVLVSHPFTGDGDVVPLATPAGTVATTTHLGAYDRLSEAHRAIVEWCGANARELQGTNWEIYGHWSDNPAEVRTDVYYLLT